MEKEKPDQEDFKAYEKYLAGAGNPEEYEKAKNRGLGELANAQSGGYKHRVYDDPTRGDVNGLPKGPRHETNMTEPQLEQAIKDLIEARKVLTKFLTESSDLLIRNPKQTTLHEFSDNLLKFPPEIDNAFSNIVKYLDPQDAADFGEMTLSDLPGFIKNELIRYKIILINQR